MGYIKITTKQTRTTTKYNRTKLKITKKKHIKDRADTLNKRDKKGNRTKHCRKKEKKGIVRTNEEQY